MCIIIIHYDDYSSLLLWFVYIPVMRYTRKGTYTRARRAYTAYTVYYTIARGVGSCTAVYFVLLSPVMYAFQERCF
jgi:hypothetical protein